MVFTSCLTVRKSPDDVLIFYSRRNHSQSRRGHPRSQTNHTSYLPTIHRARYIQADVPTLTCLFHVAKGKVESLIQSIHNGRDGSPSFSPTPHSMACLIRL